MPCIADLAGLLSVDTGLSPVITPLKQPCFGWYVPVHQQATREAIKQLPTGIQDVFKRQPDYRHYNDAQDQYLGGELHVINLRHNGRAPQSNGVRVTPYTGLTLPTFSFEEASQYFRPHVPPFTLADVDAAPAPNAVSRLVALHQAMGEAFAYKRLAEQAANQQHLADAERTLAKLGNVLAHYSEDLHMPFHLTALFDWPLPPTWQAKLETEYMHGWIDSGLDTIEPSFTQRIQAELRRRLHPEPPVPHHALRCGVLRVINETYPLVPWLVQAQARAGNDAEGFISQLPPMIAERILAASDFTVRLIRGAQKDGQKLSPAQLRPMAQLEALADDWQAGKEIPASAPKGTAYYAGEASIPQMGR